MGGCSAPFLPLAFSSLARAPIFLRFTSTSTSCCCLSLPCDISWHFNRLLHAVSCSRYNKEGKQGRRVAMGVLFSCPADDYDPVDLQEEAPAPATSSTAGAGEPAPAILRARSSSAPGRSGSASTARSAKRLQPTRSRAARSFSAISSPPSRAGHGPASPSRSASPRWPLPAVFPPGPVVVHGAGDLGRGERRRRFAFSITSHPKWVRRLRHLLDRMFLP